MNILTSTVVASTNPEHVDVVWANGLAKQGRFHVALPQNLPDREVIAELAAMHELLVVRAIFGEERAGNVLDLCVSSGAIKKLAQRRSNKEHLAPYANFLAIRFADARITVAQKCPWLKPRAEQNVAKLTPSGGALEDELELRPFGRVALTRHAIDRFAIRSNNAESMADTWRALRLILSNRLEEVVLNEAQRREKLERHGVEGRIFHHRDSHWNFVVCYTPGQTARILTSYYERR